MAIALSLVMAIIAGLLAIPVVLFFVEIFAAVALPQRQLSLPATHRPRVAVLVPAHNESTGMLPTLSGVKAQLRAGDRLLVVADNCTDDTAAVAATAGAEVIERKDLTTVGKGYALDCGISQLRADPPEIVIIVDADCTVVQNTIDRLASACIATGHPHQALYLMAAPERTKIDFRVAVFAFRVKNWMRPLGLRALGLPCQLMGTGMAFPWPAISIMNLATPDPVEDLKLGLDLVRAGSPAFFCPTARVDSSFPSSVKGARSQRNRWEQGHLGVIATSIPRLVWEGFVTGNFRLLLLALDAAVPPLTLLGLLVALMAAISAIAYMFDHSTSVLAISAICLFAYLAALAVCWIKVGRDILPPRAVLSIAKYVLDKLRLYGKMLTRNGNLQWIRTDRTKTGDDTE